MKGYTSPIALIAGARPNFMKIAPLVWQLSGEGIAYELIHTGQHYDHSMSKVFFEQLDLPEPDHYLGVGSGTHNYQTATTMLALEKVFPEIRPSLVVVVGDVNSTLAGALAAVKSGVPVAHVEAGLRSYDRSMPEEINRAVTDAVSDLLFTPSRDADENLSREGIDGERIFFVGNIMIDTLVHFRKDIEASTVLDELGVRAREYIYITLHRPSNVDDPVCLRGIAEALREVGELGLGMVFPLHPRTRKSIESFGLREDFERIGGLHLCEPVGYVDSIALAGSARAVLTDSGGLQEETSFLGVPCLTLRPNTERPVTIKVGTNRLLDEGPGSIPAAVREALSGGGPKQIPELWDGKTAGRVLAVIKEYLGRRYA